MLFQRRVERALQIVFAAVLLLALARHGIAFGANSQSVVGFGLGLNVPSPSTGVVFVDAMKQAAPWTSNAPLQLDLNGNVVALRLGQVADTTIYAKGTYPAGDYTLLYDGTGTFVVSPLSGRVVSREPGRLIVRVVPKVGYGIRLRLTATDPRHYPTNVRLIVPGYAMRYGISPFYPAFLNSLRPFRVLRFGEWMRPQADAGRTWATRTGPASFTQAGPAGASVEAMVWLANATGTDPWFTLPVDASDEYVFRFAQNVARGLDPRLRPIFEYGNEVWKAGTPGYLYAMAAGSRLGFTPDPRRAALRWYAARSGRVFTLTDRAFGSAAARPIHILSGPAATPGTDGAAAAAEILDDASAVQHADAFAVDAGTAQATLGLLAVPDALLATGTLAQRSRLPLVAYAAGVLSPSLLTTWHAAGGGLLVTDVQTGVASSAAAYAYASQTLRPDTALSTTSGIGTLQPASPAAGAMSNTAPRTFDLPAVGMPQSGYDRPGSLLLGENFLGSSTPAHSWFGAGDACLTAGTAFTPASSLRPCNGSAARDADGSGALQLTPDAPNRRGLVVYRVPLPTARGVAVTFTDYAFGRAAAAGGDIHLYLTDASQLMPTMLSVSSALLPNAYVSIDLDANGVLAVRGAAAAGYPGLEERPMHWAVPRRFRSPQRAPEHASGRPMRRRFVRFWRPPAG